MSEEGEQRVKIVSIEVPFLEMVVLIFKFLIASIPAVIFAALLVFFLIALFGGLSSGMMR